MPEGKRGAVASPGELFATLTQGQACECRRNHGPCKHGIMELLRLEEPSRIAEPKRSSSAAKATAKPCPQVPRPHIF